MSGNPSKYKRKLIAYLIMILLLFLIIKVEVDVFYVMLMASAMYILAIYMEWDNYKNFKQQKGWNKLWLELLAIAAAGVFFSALFAIFAVILGLYDIGSK
jgi:ABC-type phosphate/phosphonate transport system permease subunit